MSSSVAMLRPAPAPAELHHLAFAEAFARAHADDRRHWPTRGRWMAWSAGEGWREATQPLGDMARAINRIVPTDERTTWYRLNHFRDALTMAAESLSRHEWDRGDALLGLPAGRVVNLTTGVDRAQTPDDWITMATGCGLAGEISTAWSDFVGEACGGDGEMASAYRRPSGRRRSGTTGSIASRSCAATAGRENRRSPKPSRRRSAATRACSPRPCSMPETSNTRQGSRACSASVS